MTNDQDNQSLASYLAASVAVALAEDIGSGDLTARLVPAEQQASARIISREEYIVCGQPWVEEVFRQLDASIDVDWQSAEGARATAEQIICVIRGPARPILSGERTALNFMQLMSATATIARRYVDAVEGTGARILDTRKTIPGLRRAQKYAVQIGGAQNHRIGLYDAILIKENHIAATGSITQAIAQVATGNEDVLLEVEVETIDQVAEALHTDAQRLLLDNFSVTDMRRAVALRNEHNRSVTLEASGGISLDSIRPIAETGVDFISIGAITKNIQAVDLSMRFEVNH